MSRKNGDEVAVPEVAAVAVAAEEIAVPYGKVAVPYDKVSVPGFAIVVVSAEEVTTEVTVPEVATAAIVDDEVAVSYGKVSILRVAAVAVAAEDVTSEVAVSEITSKRGKTKTARTTRAYRTEKIGNSSSTRLVLVVKLQSMIKLVIMTDGYSL